MNTVAHSAAAVCCPTERDALRSDRCGWRATWWGTSTLYRLAVAHHIGVLPDLEPERWWTR